MTKVALHMPIAFIAIMVLSQCCGLNADTIEERLAMEDPARLARAAREKGRERQGAIVFHRLACTKCHVSGGQPEIPGPDLSELTEDASDPYLVESVLHPSRVIKKGFESVAVITTTGNIMNGLLVADEDESLVLRDAARDFESVTIDKKDVRELIVSNLSIMPEKQVNALASRRQFLDLLRYLMEIREGGLARARELEPSPEMVKTTRAPETTKEKPVGPTIETERIDHAGIISLWGEERLESGRQVFDTLCIDCHGQGGEIPSLPTARAFGSQKMKFGADPYKMYLTLTNGNGIMGPMVYLAPRERYDVIHYIREAFMKPYENEYFVVDEAYLDSLPKGTSLGEVPPPIDRDYGPGLASQFENRVSCAMSVTLGTMSIAYNLHTMNQADIWVGGFLELKSTQHMRGKGGGVPTPVGQSIDGLTGWRWGHDGDLDHEKERLLPRGPLAGKWLSYKGHYLHGNRMIFSYSIDGRPILELPEQEQGLVAVRHTLKIGPGQALVLGVAQLNAEGSRTEGVIHEGQKHPTSTEGTAVNTICITGVRTDEGLRRFTAATVFGDSDGLIWSVDERHRLVLRIPRDTGPRLIQVLRFSAEGADSLDTFVGIGRLRRQAQIVDPHTLTGGGPLRWSEVLVTSGTPGDGEMAYAMDTVTLPESTPWNTWFRTSALAFFSDGRLVVSTYGGDVWVVSGIDESLSKLEWKRYAAGLYEPMGLQVVDDIVYVNCKDRITRLHDLNEDGEADFYESFSADTDVSIWYHSFNFDLQRDREGNFYYAKCGMYTDHALPGAVIKISPDGKRREVYCTGFRVPNGMGITGDDRLLASDNQGNWTPASKVSLLRPGGFYGYVNTLAARNGEWAPDGGQIDHKNVIPPRTFDQPIIWMPPEYDNSSGGQLWVDDRRWGPLSGRLLHTSFGMGWMYYIMLQDVGDATQAAIIKLPYDFGTGIMRARVNPRDGQVYAVGLNGWNGHGRVGLLDGGIYRLRYTGKPIMMVTDCKVEKDGLRLSFNFALDEESTKRKGSFQVEAWNYRWAESYGSKMYSPTTGQEGRDRLKILLVRPGADGRSVKLDIPGIRPVHQVFVQVDVTGSNNKPFHEEIYLTINRVPDARETPHD